MPPLSLPLPLAVPRHGLRSPARPPAPPGPALTSAAQRLPQHLSSAQVAPARAAAQRQLGEAVPLASLRRDAGVLRLLEDAPHVSRPGRSRPPSQSLLQPRPERASGAGGPGWGVQVPAGSPAGAAPLVRPGRSGDGRGGAAAGGPAGRRQRRRRRLRAAQGLQIARRFWVQEQPVRALPNGRGSHDHTRRVRGAAPTLLPSSPREGGGPSPAAFKGTAGGGAGQGRGDAGEAGRTTPGNRRPAEPLLRRWGAHEHVWISGRLQDADRPAGAAGGLRMGKTLFGTTPKRHLVADRLPSAPPTPSPITSPFPDPPTCCTARPGRGGREEGLKI